MEHREGPDGTQHSNTPLLHHSIFPVLSLTLAFATSQRHHKTDAGLRLHHLSGRFPSVPGPATHRQVPSSLVRRRAQRMDYLSILFSGVPGRWLRIWPRAHPILQTAHADNNSPRHSPRRSGLFADRAFCELETENPGSSSRKHSFVVGL